MMKPMKVTVEKGTEEEPKDEPLNITKLEIKEEEKEPEIIIFPNGEKVIEKEPKKEINVGLLVSIFIIIIALILFMIFRRCAFSYSLW